MTIGETTLKQFRESLSDWKLEEWLVWPPDLFALTSLLLESTGAYRYSVCPPRGIWPDDPKWEESVRRDADDWRLWITGNQEGMPGLLQLNIERIAKYEKTVSVGALRSIASESLEENQASSDADAWEVCRSFLELHALSDQACRGFGLPTSRRDKLHRSSISGLLYQANMLLATRGTLSRLPRHKALVLPKMRTPAVGLTLRSLSHHLTAHVSEVDVAWRAIPWINRDEDTLNIMIFPWPQEMSETWFWPAHQNLKRRSSEPARYFTYTGCKRDLPIDEIMNLLSKAEERVTRIHMLVFPELAITQKELRELQLALTARQERDRMPMLIGGIRDDKEGGGSGDGELGSNRIVLSTFFAGTWYDLYQHKHHRWKLDASQIKQYNLSGVLAADKDWWEAIEIRERRITFLAPNGWLVLCPLICEDLARLEPVSELIRGVGPTLLIAILLDGPQLKQRWSSRYASALADDPGTSVLTVSSLGMAKHATPPPGKGPNGTIALWKDQVNGWEEVALRDKEDAVVLTVSATRHREYAADGRSDGGTSAVFTLRGTHSLKKADRISAMDATTTHFRSGRDIDFKELTIFTYLIDALLDADEDLIDDIGHWALGEERRSSRWCSRSRLGKLVLVMIREGIRRNYAALGSSQEAAKGEFRVFVRFVSKVTKEARNRALAIVASRRALGENIFEVEELMMEWQELVISAQNILESLSGDRRYTRELTVVALSILWAVYKRVANHRREFGLTSENVELLRHIEELLPRRWDEIWIKGAPASELLPKRD